MNNSKDHVVDMSENSFYKEILNHEMHFKFYKNTRDNFIRSVLNHMKGHLELYQNLFDVSFERKTYNHGFGYKFSLTPNLKNDNEFNRDFEKYTMIRHYVSDVFYYIFGEHISVCEINDESKFTIEFEITSEF